MSEQSSRRTFANRKAWLGGGIAVAVAVVVTQVALDFPLSKDVVGTITQTLVGPDFDLSLLPAALELSALPRERPLFGFSSRFTSRHHSAVHFK